jgi:serine/threonine-protein kinase
VVRVEDEIWLFLGEVIDGYEPIVFKNGEFKVSKIVYAMFPALRVTGLGASAYARFYNRRLPSYAEWLYALGDEGLQKEISAPNHDDPAQGNDMESMHSQMHTGLQAKTPTENTPGLKISPVNNLKPNSFGIRGLNKKIKEWGIMIPQQTSRDKLRDAEYVVLPSSILRQPWEGFAEVGFRCVQEINIKNK